jgi:hypothetical protein
MTRPEPPYWPHRCPTCARYVANIRVWANDDRLTDVRGTCKRHGDVALEGASWDWDLYFGEPA